MLWVSQIAINLLIWMEIDFFCEWEGGQKAGERKKIGKIALHLRPYYSKNSLFEPDFKSILGLFYASVFLIQSLLGLYRASEAF